MKTNKEKYILMLCLSAVLLFVSLLPFILTSIYDKSYITILDSKKTADLYENKESRISATELLKLWERSREDALLSVSVDELAIQEPDFLSEGVPKILEHVRQTVSTHIDDELYPDIFFLIENECFKRIDYLSFTSIDKKTNTTVQTLLWRLEFEETKGRATLLINPNGYELISILCCLYMDPDLEGINELIYKKEVKKEEILLHMKNSYNATEIIADNTASNENFLYRFKGKLVYQETSEFENMVRFLNEIQIEEKDIMLRYGAECSMHLLNEDA